MQFVQYLIFTPLMLLVSAYLTMCVEFASNSCKHVKGARQEYLQVASLGALASTVGLGLALMLHNDYLSSVVWWTFLPAIFWAASKLLFSNKSANLFLGSGERCGEKVSKLISFVSTRAGKKDADKMSDTAAKNLVAVMEKDLSSRKDGDDGRAVISK